AQFGMLTGSLTYGIYLWHYMIVRSRSDVVSAFADRLAASGHLTSLWQKILVFHVVQISLVLLLSYSLAWITFHLIETRFRPGLYKPELNGRKPVLTPAMAAAYTEAAPQRSSSAPSSLATRSRQ